MLVNEGVYVAERRSACSDCFLNLFDGIFRSWFFGAFYCFARLLDDWFLGHAFLYRTVLRTTASIASGSHGPIFTREDSELFSVPLVTREPGMDAPSF